jgi:hypothetical protein
MKKLRDMYYSPNIIRIIKSRRMRWAEHVARLGKRNTYRLLVGEPEGRRPPERPIHGWVDNIKIDLAEMGWCAVDGLVWLRIGTSLELL